MGGLLGKVEPVIYDHGLLRPPFFSDGNTIF